jgi:hypothetical protein
MSNYDYTAGAIAGSVAGSVGVLIVILIAILVVYVVFTVFVILVNNLIISSLSVLMDLNSFPVSMPQHSSSKCNHNY